jgi:hypothetical protein
LKSFAKIKVLLQKSKIFEKTFGFLIRCEKTAKLFEDKNTSSKIFDCQFKNRRYQNPRLPRQAQGFDLTALLF